jgi:rare lipoprotein A
LKSIHFAIPRHSNRRRAVLLLTAGILSAVGTGSILGWKASADPRPAAFEEGSASVAQVNLDSLYVARAAAVSPSDSSFIAEVRAERSMGGNASWYGPGFYGHKTSNGERFDSQSLTAAHRTLPFGTLVRVVDTQSGKSTLVRINDRGPFCHGRILDLSEAAARSLGVRGKGTANVRLEVFPASTLHADANAQSEGEGSGSLITFDPSGKAVMLRGYSVMVAENASFELARTLQTKIASQGDDKVFLTQIKTGGNTTYRVSIGLFGSERLCQSQLVDLADDYHDASILRFGKGSVVATTVASTSQNDASGRY